MLRQERKIRELEHATDRFTLDGDAVDPATPGGQDLGRALDRPEQHPGDDLGDREQAQLERGHRRDVATPAAECPEQLGFRGGVDVQLTAFGGHHVGRQDVLQARPCLRTIQLMPPPSAYPSTPTSGEVPAR